MRIRSWLAFTLTITLVTGTTCLAPSLAQTRRSQPSRSPAPTYYVPTAPRTLVTQPAAPRYPSANAYQTAVRKVKTADGRTVYETYQIPAGQPPNVATITRAMTPEEAKLVENTRKALEKLKAAKKGEQRRAAEKTLEEALELQFEARMRAREKELKKVEQRVKQLREQLDKRRDAKNEIIQLRLKTMINEVEGLGF